MTTSNNTTNKLTTSTNLEELFKFNQQWAAEAVQQKPDFFTALMQQQNPQFMWIGCSDSRVPANQITGLAPGEVFVHRNVANMVVHSDLNMLSTVQYAVDALKVEHIMVVGHYGCGGVKAALSKDRIGLADNWIRHIKDVRNRHWELLLEFPPEMYHDVLCELNVIEQTLNAARTSVVQEAWENGQKLHIHGWIYGLKNGLISNLHMTVGSRAEIKERYAAAIAEVRTRARA